MARSRWRRRRRAGAALRVGLGLGAFLLLVAVAAPLLAPYDPAEQLDTAAARFLPPGSVRQAIHLDNGSWLLAKEVKATPRGLAVLRLDSWQEIPGEKIRNLRPHGVADQRLFLLGTDRYGRDLLSRLLFGARVSLSIGLLAAGLAVTVGVLLGAVAGWYGGLTETILMRGADGLLAFPRLLLVLAMAALWQADAFRLAVLLGATSWMEVARLVRAELLALKTEDFTLAARASGVPAWRILGRHLLPHALTPVLVDAALRVGDTILLEASLSFLGLGIQPPTPSWGNLIAEAHDALLSAWWVAALPGVAIVLTVFSFNLMGDGLRDALDPRGR